MLSPAEEIKSRLDIVEIIGEYIALRPAGGNFRGLCPFHQEKTPSFMVSQEKQIWHCFGCGKGGDVLSFIMEMDGLSFPESLRLLAPRAGVQLPETALAEQSKRSRLLDALKLSASYYHQVLVENPKHPEVAAINLYLAKRGLKPETIKAWSIGYSPESWDDLCLFLKKRGYREEELIAAGLAVARAGQRGAYNRFRNRVMFPISDAAGQVLGFSARLNPSQEGQEKAGGKYINSPQSEIYDKGKVVFGLDKAKAAIKAQNLAIIVEGQMDVISTHQAGFNNTVASSGTALTADQVKLIKRYTNRLAFALDMDAAGQLASDRGIREAVAQDLSVKVIIIPIGKDPDECVRRDPAAFSRAIAEAKDLLDYFLEKALENADLSRPEDSKRVWNDMQHKILDFSGTSKTEQDFWIKRITQRLNINENDYRTDLKRMMEDRARRPDPAPASAPETAPAPVVLSREEKVSESLLALAVRHPGVLPYIVANLEPAMLAGELAAGFYKNLIIYYNNDDNKEKLNYGDLKHWLSASKRELSDFLDKIALLGDRDFSNLEAEQAKSEAIKLIAGLRKNAFQKRQAALQQQLAQAETAGDTERIAAIMEELRQLAIQSRATIF